MIYLTTATPGSFKTLSTLMYVDKYRKDELKEGRERNVYYYNINQLNLDGWFEFEHPQTWFDLPDNSIVVIDECQKKEAGFGAMSHMKEQPLCITELETHRHRGFDIFLITQGPHLINSRIKPLVNVHFHLRRLNGWNKAKLYRSDGIISNPENKNNLKDLEFKWFKPNPKFYDVYQSATMHTVKKRIPKLFIYALLVFIVFAFFLYKAYSLFYSKKPQEQPQIQPQQQSQTQKNILNPLSSLSKSYDSDSFNPLVQYIPRVTNIPHTAPAYDELQKPRQFPKPNCISSDTNCKCYTQQATVMIGFPDDVCRSYVKNGYYDPTISNNTASTIAGRDVRKQHTDRNRSKPVSSNSEYLIKKYDYLLQNN